MKAKLLSYLLLLMISATSYGDHYKCVSKQHIPIYLSFHTTGTPFLGDPDDANHILLLSYDVEPYSGVALYLGTGQYTNDGELYINHYKKENSIRMFDGYRGKETRKLIYNIDGEKFVYSCK